MDTREFSSTYNTMLDDAAAIIHNQQVLSNVHYQLDRNLLNPLEQDYIYRDQFGQFPSEAKVNNIAGVKVLSRILHQTGIGLRDIQGADLLYEIENSKFVLLQYKRTSNGSVKNDKKQLETLLCNCPDICQNGKRRKSGSLIIPLKNFGFCGNWYRVLDGVDERNVTACEAEQIFQGQTARSFESFQIGLSKSSFTELFVSCRIGALVSKTVDIKVRDLWIANLLEAKHFILSILQNGSWRVNKN